MGDEQRTKETTRDGEIETERATESLCRIKYDLLLVKPHIANYKYEPTLQPNTPPY